MNTIKYPVISEYTMDSEWLNHYSRKGQGASELEIKVVKLKEELSLLQNNVPRITYRGQKHKKSPCGFISTSLSLKVAKGFGECITRFWGYGGSIKSYSWHPQEEEVLYPPLDWVDCEGVYVPKELVEKYLELFPEEIDHHSEGGVVVTTEDPQKGFYLAEELQWEFKCENIFRMEENFLQVSRDIPEAGWGVAVPLSTN